MILHNIFVNSVWGKRYIKTGSVKKSDFVSKGKSRRHVESMRALEEPRSEEEATEQSSDHSQSESGQDSSSDSKELIRREISAEDVDDELFSTALVTIPDDISELTIENNVDTLFAEIGLSNDVFAKNDPLTIDNEKQETRLKALYWIDIIEMLLLGLFLPMYLTWGNAVLPYQMLFPVHAMVFIGFLGTYYCVGRTVDFDAIRTYKKKHPN